MLKRFREKKIVLQLHKYSWVRCVQNKLKWKDCYFYQFPGDTISNLKEQYCLWAQISKFMSLMLGLSSCSQMVECICVTSEEIKKLIFNKIFALCDFSGKQDIFMLTDLHWPHIFFIKLVVVQILFTIVDELFGMVLQSFLIHFSRKTFLKYL